MAQVSLPPASPRVPTRLDPDKLDSIVAELALSDADAIDRFQLWYKDLLRRGWDWLKSATGGEGGWLDRVGQWLEGLLSGVGGGDDGIRADGILAVLYYGSAALLLFGLCYVALTLWRLYRPVTAGRSTSLSYLPEAIAPEGSPSKLAIELQAAALFSQVCRQLVGSSRLNITPDATPETIVATAQVNAAQRSAFAQLARATDRSLFGGWVPSEAELAELVRTTDQLLAELAVDSS